MLSPDLPLFTLSRRIAWPLLVHICEILLHVFRREHVDSFETKRLHDVVLDPIVQTHTSGTLEDNAGPVDVCAVLPLFTWLVDKWHAKDISDLEQR